MDGESTRRPGVSGVCARCPAHVSTRCQRTSRAVSTPKCILVFQSTSRKRHSGSFVNRCKHSFEAESTCQGGSRSRGRHAAELNNSHEVPSATRRGIRYASPQATCTTTPHRNPSQSLSAARDNYMHGVASGTRCVATQRPEQLPAPRPDHRPTRSASAPTASPATSSPSSPPSTSPSAPARGARCPSPPPSSSTPSAGA